MLKQTLLQSQMVCKRNNFAIFGCYASIAPATRPAAMGGSGSLTRIWAQRGSRPTAPRDQRCQSAYLFGAVCPDRGVGAVLVLPRANVHAMNL